MSEPTVKQDGNTTFVEYDGGATEERQSNPDIWRQGSFEVNGNRVINHDPITHDTSRDPPVSIPERS